MQSSSTNSAATAAAPSGCGSEGPNICRSLVPLMIVMEGDDPREGRRPRRRLKRRRTKQGVLRRRRQQRGDHHDGKEEDAARRSKAVNAVAPHGGGAAGSWGRLYVQYSPIDCPQVDDSCVPKWLQVPLRLGLTSSLLLLITGRSSFFFSLTKGSFP